jgi:hypothetical protein
MTRRKIPNLEIGVRNFDDHLKLSSFVNGERSCLFLVLPLPIDLAVENTAAIVDASLEQQHTVGGMLAPLAETD